MVVANAREAQGRIGGPDAPPQFAARRDPHQLFEHRRDLCVEEAEVAMTALLFDCEDLRGRELRKMHARGRGGDTGFECQLSRG